MALGRTSRAALAVLVPIAGSSCAIVWGFEDVTLEAGPADGRMISGDGSLPDANDVRTSADGAEEEQFNRLDDLTKWESFDVRGLSSNAIGFHGGAYDGRYVYFVPYDVGTPHAVVVRYDPYRGFQEIGAWKTFDVASVHPEAIGFNGAAYDGRFLYFAPFYRGTYHGRTVRLDTQAAFDQPSSWATFDLTTLDSGARGFQGAVFDGRYVYFVPNFDGTQPASRVARFDTSKRFGEAAGWTFFDVSAVSSALKGFCGGGFDGRYVYMPSHIDDTNARGAVARYDTTQPFENAASWSAFEVAKINGSSGPTRLGSALFDGRYMYFGPQAGSEGVGCTARYDTQGVFSSSESWSCFGMGTSLFRGLTSDGRNVYAVPYASAISFRDDLVIARHDPRAGAFGDPGAWSRLNILPMAGAKNGFWGGVFDGRHIYLVPAFHSKVLRFDARPSNSSPPRLGSFF